MSDDENLLNLPDDAADYVDIETFEQILEMDDDPELRDFSSALVFGFFDQATENFDKMDVALKERDLENLSSIGHFLKGSSATLGIYKIRDVCEKIQHLGNSKDETGEADIPEEEALRRIKRLLPTMKEDYKAAEAWLKEFFVLTEDAES